MERRTTQSASKDSSRGARPLLSFETTKALAELNEQCLELLIEQAAVSAEAAYAPPLLRELYDLWSRLERDGIRRASDCPYLIVDAGFCDPRRWAWAIGQGAQDRVCMLRSPFFTVERATAVRRLVLTYAWHLARSHGSSARMLLGASPQCVELLAGCTLRQINDLAERNADWLQPRWSGRVRLWRDMLLAAIAGERAMLEQVHLRGLRLLAAEMRFAMHCMGDRVADRGMRYRI